MKKTFVVVSFAALGVLSLSIRLQGGPLPVPATYCVDVFTDGAAVPADCPTDGTCVGTCSLRDAVVAANTHAGTDTINVGAGTYTFAGTTADRGEDAAASGDLDITESVVITGAGAGSSIVDGNAIDRVFQIISPASLTLSGVTVRNGNPGSDVGGGLYSDGALTITDCAITGNTAGLNGGGIDIINPGTLTLRNSTVSNNESSASNGGGLGMTGSGGAFTIVNSTISGNRAAGGGGGLSVNNNLLLANATITQNTADSDGSDGVNDLGGGLRIVGGVQIITNSIIAGNTEGGVIVNPDCSNDSGGTYNAASGYNLVGKQDGCIGGVGSFFAQTGDQVGTIAAPLDPKLQALASHGGTTQTHALQAFSPVLNLGNPTGCLDSDGLTVLTKDQRGFTRPVGGRCDIGAYENGICGDGAVDIGEACDDGNTDNTDACLNTCAAASCGDGFVDTGVEGCDDGNSSNTDACLNTCVSATCGDGIVQASVEQCDNGASNSDTAADACRTNCTDPRCGDGVVDEGEACDDGNTVNTDSCKNDCTAGPTGGTTGTVETVSSGCNLVRKHFVGHRAFN